MLPSIKSYMNIHNIINSEDGWPKTPLIHRFRFGREERFHRDNDRSHGFYDNYKELTGRDFKGDDAHAVETYMAYVLIKDSKFASKISGVCWACPVDVEIYALDGKLVGSVEKNAVKNNSPEKISISTQNTSKYIYFLDDGEYIFNVSSTDIGTMKYSVLNINLENCTMSEEKAFENIQLAKGKQFTSAVKVVENAVSDIEDDSTGVKLYVLGTDNAPEKEVLPDGNGTEIPIETSPTPTTYIVCFDPVSGIVTPTTAITSEDGKLTILPLPTRGGYTFDGWYTAADGGEKITAETVFTADATVYAHWTGNVTPPATYTITFNPNGGAGSMSPATVKEGDTFTLPACAFTAPAGKEFKAWQINGKEYAPGASYLFTSDTAVTAVWKDIPVVPVTHTVTFDPSGGTVTPATAATGKDGKLTALPTPVREGHTFDGWYTAADGGEKVTVETVFTADATVYAHWTGNVTPPVTYTITFNSNGGAGVMDAVTIPANTAYTLPNCAFTAPAGMDFQAWRINGVDYFPGESYTITANTVVTAIWRDKSSSDTNYIAILKTANGEIICNTRYAAQGERVTLSAHPAAGYELESVTVTDVRGRTVTVREVSDNRYTFTMPATRVEVAATFIKTEADTTPKDDEVFTGLGTPGISGIVLNPAPLPFTDVQPQHWFYDNVDYVWKHYLMSGVSDTRFAPQLTTSRAMIWTILARMNNVRTDVNPGATWYERGMLWAMEQGVTDGTNPVGDITREQLAAMLWRNAGRPAPGDAADLTQFRDSNAVSGYAQTAVRWAVSVGILNGSNGEIDPQGTATRAQVAAMAARYGDRFA